jgi:hypothetical protein
MRNHLLFFKSAGAFRHRMWLGQRGGGLHGIRRFASFSSYVNLDSALCMPSWDLLAAYFFLFS